MERPAVCFRRIALVVRRRELRYGALCFLPSQVEGDFRRNPVFQPPERRHEFDQRSRAELRPMRVTPTWSWRARLPVFQVLAWRSRDVALHKASRQVRASRKELAQSANVLPGSKSDRARRQRPFAMSFVWRVKKLPPMLPPRSS